jgi:hypothetical protein
MRKMPPAEYRFKAGKSGNPRGRPIGSISKRDVLVRVASLPVPLPDGQPIPLIKALLLALRNKAAEGNISAIKCLDSVAGLIGADSEQNYVVLLAPRILNMKDEKTREMVKREQQALQDDVRGWYEALTKSINERPEG